MKALHFVGLRTLHLNVVRMVQQKSNFWRVQIATIFDSNYCESWSLLKSSWFIELNKVSREWHFISGAGQNNLEKWIYHLWAFYSLVVLIVIMKLQHARTEEQVISSQFSNSFINRGKQYDQVSHIENPAYCPAWSDVCPTVGCPSSSILS